MNGWVGMGKLLPEDNLAYQSPQQQFISWLVMAFGMIIPGTLLAVNPSFWTTTAILGSALGLSPFIVAVIGGVVAVAGLASLVLPHRDIPYTVAMIFYALVAISTFIALCQGVTVGALFVAPLLVAWLYYVATGFTSQRAVSRDPDSKG